MPGISPLLDQSLDFDPAADFDAFLKAAPSRWAVYLFVDEANQPVQLLCVKNLRYSLKRRLGGAETIGLSRRVNYRELVRRIYFRRVDSSFEADWLYYEVARAVFPQTYRGMVGFRPAWFVHVNPETTFPRYVKTTDLSRSGLLAGPLEDKHAAARVIHLIEDAFDLCRYYQILVEAPTGEACAYKEMGKCPAPCDGSISMEQYHRMIAWSAQVLVEPDAEQRSQLRRMQQAAADLQFEWAGKIKAFSDQLNQLGKGPFRFVRNLREFAFLSIQNGPKTGTLKLFLILPGSVQEVLGVRNGPTTDLAEILRQVLAKAASHQHRPLDQREADLVGIVTQHLFAAKNRSGYFLSLRDISERELTKALGAMGRQAMIEENLEEEGVMRELQSIPENNASADVE